MKLYMLFLFLIMPASLWGQQDDKLKEYLLNNRYSIDIAQDSSLYFSSQTAGFITGVMKEKSLFVLGESAMTHAWTMYNRLRPVFIGALEPLNLRSSIIEYGRTTAYDNNLFIGGSYSIDTIPWYNREATRNELRMIKKSWKGSSSFRYVGIDFERPASFYLAVNYLLADIDKDKLNRSKEYIEQLTDSTYRKASLAYFHHYYKHKIRRGFRKHDKAIKEELGGKYEMLKYFCTNTNTTTPNSTRDRALNRNLLREMREQDTTAKYFMSIGAEHTKNSRQSMLHRAMKAGMLKDRIITMNVYRASAGDGKNDWMSGLPYLPFMKDAVLQAFKQAANSNIVIFDLTKLPEEYAYMNQFTGLLLFVNSGE